MRNLAAALPDAAAGRSQAETAYQRLRGEILHGELMPGAKLRAAELQDSFELGLTPIREALMRLTAEGLVVTESHRGARVAEITPEGLADLMRTRRDLERLCLPRAIERGDEAWEAEIVTALHLLTRTPLPGPDAGREAVTLWETRHRRFHLALVCACGSEWLLRFWHSLADHAERYRKARLSHYHEEAAALQDDAVRARDMNENHARIADAVLARDAARAVALMDAHLGDTERAVARLLGG